MDHVMKNIFLFLLLVGLLLISCSQKEVKITNPSQLEDKRICVLTGSAGDIAARKAFPNATFLDHVGSVEAGLAVKTGKAEAFIYDKSVLLNLQAKNEDLIILDEPVSQLEVAAVIQKDNYSLLMEINTAIIELREEGKLDELRNKWVDTKYETVPKLSAITNAGGNGTLKMGTCAIFEPFAFQAEGELAGLDIELGMLIGEKLDKKIEVVDMMFDGLIPALNAGKIDFALSNFNVTEERKKITSFSEPYIVNDISILVKK